MQFIKENTPDIGYPVGTDIPQAIKRVNSVFEKIKRLIASSEIIHIWVRGSSGAILGTLLADRISSYPKNVKVWYIRKTDEWRHEEDGEDYYTRSNEMNIIIDDFISMGDTITSIWNHMQEKGVKKVDILILEDGNRLQQLDQFIPIDTLISDTKPRHYPTVYQKEKYEQAETS